MITKSLIGSLVVRVMPFTQQSFVKKFSIFTRGAQNVESTGSLIPPGETGYKRDWLALLMPYFATNGQPDLLL